MDYVLGLATNERLKAEIVGEHGGGVSGHGAAGAGVQRVFLSDARQLVAGAARGGQGRAFGERLESPRFVVTSLGAERWEARRLYEDLYRARPQPLNRTFRKRPAWSHATSRERDRRSFCVSISMNAT